MDRSGWLGACAQDHLDRRAWPPRGTRETASRSPDCAASLRRTIPIRKRADHGIARAIRLTRRGFDGAWVRVPRVDHARQSRWSCAPRPARGPDAVRSGRREAGRKGADSELERGIEGGGDDQRFTGNVELARTLFTTRARLAQPSRSAWRSEWRSKTKRAGR